MPYLLKMRCGLSCLIYSFKAAIEKGEYGKDLKQQEFLDKVLHCAQEMHGSAIPKSIMCAQDLFFYIRSLSFPEAIKILLPIFKDMASYVVPEGGDIPCTFAAYMDCGLDREVLSSGYSNNPIYTYVYKEANLRIATQIKYAVSGPRITRKSHDSHIALRKNQVAPRRLEAKKTQNNDLKKGRIASITNALMQGLMYCAGFLQNICFNILYYFNFKKNPNASDAKHMVDTAVVENATSIKICDSPDIKFYDDELQSIVDGLRYFTAILERESPITLETVPIEELIIVSGHPLKEQHKVPSVYQQAGLDELMRGYGCRRGTLTQFSCRDTYFQVLLKIHEIWAELQARIINQTLSIDIEKKLMSEILDLMRRLDPREIEYHEWLRSIARYNGSPIWNDNWKCPCTQGPVPHDVAVMPLWDFVMPFVMSAYGFFMLRDGALNAPKTQEDQVFKMLEAFRKQHFPHLSIEKLIKLGKELPLIKTIHKMQAEIDLSEAEKETLSSSFQDWQIEKLCAFLPEHDIFDSPPVFKYDKNGMLYTYVSMQTDNDNNASASEDMSMVLSRKRKHSEIGGHKRIAVN